MFRLREIIENFVTKIEQLNAKIKYNKIKVKFVRVFFEGFYF